MKDINNYIINNDLKQKNCFKKIFNFDLNKLIYPKITTKKERIKRNNSNRFNPTKLLGFMTKLGLIPLGVWLTGSQMLWKQGYLGDGVTVGIIDSGIDPSHNDLKYNLNKNYSFVGDEEYRFMNHHGTHVAGIVAANGFIKGVAPMTKINDYRVFDENGKVNKKNVPKAIEMAVDDGCDIINMSFGGRNFKDLRKSVEYANSKGVLLISASGNESSNLSWKSEKNSFPASYSNVLSVSSINYDMEHGAVSLEECKYSNRNENVDLCAYGHKVLSTALDGQYCYLSGTSMACPHVSGYAALLCEKARINKENPKELFNIVKASAIPINVNHLIKTDSKVNSITGAGLLSAYPEIPTKDKKGNFILKGLNESINI